MPREIRWLYVKDKHGWVPVSRTCGNASSVPNSLQYLGSLKQRPSLRMDLGSVCRPVAACEWHEIEGGIVGGLPCVPVKAGALLDRVCRVLSAR